jgi:hypothetical protein
MHSPQNPVAMKHDLKTDPALESILEALVAREPIFHRPEHGTTRADFERMTLPDFWEIGASGSIYSRDFVLAELERRYQTQSPEQDVWETSDFHCRGLAPDTYLLTYTLVQETRRTRRSTIWQQTPTGWKIAFHQGTIVQTPEKH